MQFSVVLVLLLSFVNLFSATAAIIVNTIGLKPLLSSKATISYNRSSAPRWSDFDAPTPRSIVNVAMEDDVLVTVQYCIKHGIPFLAQNGGHGWATTFTLKQQGIIINLAGIKQVTFDSTRTQVTLQGGALIADVVAAANANGALVPTGTCNCVGTLGAILGGGVGNLMGLYGLGIDNLVSLNVVTPDGEAVTLTPSNTDLWFAMRGAGPNFGIVTSAVMKSYPVTAASDLNAWLGPLIFTSDKLESLITAIQTLTFQPQMALSLLFANSGDSTAPPAIICTVFYYGDEIAGKAAFAPIFAAGPIVDRTAITPYTEWNAAGDVACRKGPRKPNFGAGLAQMDPATWRAVYNEFSTFIQQPDAENSTVIMNAYAMDQANTVPDTATAYPFRSSIRFNAIWSALYRDPSFDATAVQYGVKARDMWRATSGLDINETYINNAFGDESLSTVYGVNLKRLQAIKAAVDPYKRFNQWFPLL